MPPRRACSAGLCCELCKFASLDSHEMSSQQCGRPFCYDAESMREASAVT